MNMLKKCDFPGCDKAGTCRAPKTRDLREYWNFCPAHAAAYNKNWNYYENMSPDDIEAEWERDTFGESTRDRDARVAADAEYTQFIKNFLTGHADFDIGTPRRRTLPTSISNALRVFSLPPDASWRDVQSSYRKLAKQYHPDTTKHSDRKMATDKFTKISAAYDSLKKYFGK